MLRVLFYIWFMLSFGLILLLCKKTQSRNSYRNVFKFGKKCLGILNFLLQQEAKDAITELLRLKKQYKDEFGEEYLASNVDRNASIPKV